MSKLENIKVVSKELNLSKDKIKKMIKNNEISFENRSGVYFIDRDEVKEKLDNSLIPPLNELSKVSDLLLKYYKNTKEQHYKDKSDLIQNVIRNHESGSFEIYLLKDFINTQLKFKNLRLQQGTHNLEDLYQRSLYLKINQWLEESHDDIQVVNVNYM